MPPYFVSSLLPHAPTATHHRPTTRNRVVPMSKSHLATESACRERELALKDPAHDVYVGLTEGRGRGLFIRRNAKPGETVLTERPLVAMQSLDNAHDVTVCRNCMGFVGDVISQLEILSGIPRHACIERFETRHEDGSLGSQKNPGALSGLHCCLQGCGEVYCSPECRAEHFESGHRLLCVGPVPEEEASTHPLVAFRVHAMQTNEIFLLVGEVVARIVSSFIAAAAATDDRSSAITAAQAPFADFVQHPWWDVAVAREKDGEETRRPPLSDTLRSLCERSASLLRDALSPLPPELEGVVSAERVGRIVGMFEQNNVGIRAPSPLPSMLTELLALEGEGLDCVVEEASSLVSRVLSGTDEDLWCPEDDQDDGSRESKVIEERKLEREGVRSCDSSSVGCSDGCEVSKHSMVVEEKKAAGSDGEPDNTRVLEEAVDDEDIFAPLDGTALYTLVCTMNHSCRPNCVVKYPGRLRRYGIGDVRADPLVTQVVLLGNVSAGEELTQSYISVDMDVEERRNALEDYGFFCRCPRCLEEENDVQG